MTDKWVRGEDLGGNIVWLAYKFDKMWWGTRREDLFTVHSKLEAVVSHYLDACPTTSYIRTSWQTMSFPERVIVNRIAELVTAELKESSDA